MHPIRRPTTNVQPLAPGSLGRRNQREPSDSDDSSDAEPPVQRRGLDIPPDVPQATLHGGSLPSNVPMHLADTVARLPDPSATARPAPANRDRATLRAIRSALEENLRDFPTLSENERASLAWRFGTTLTDAGLVAAALHGAAMEGAAMERANAVPTTEARQQSLRLGKFMLTVPNVCLCLDPILQQEERIQQAYSTLRAAYRTLAPDVPCPESVSSASILSIYAKLVNYALELPDDVMDDGLTDAFACFDALCTTVAHAVLTRLYPAVPEREHVGPSDSGERPPHDVLAAMRASLERSMAADDSGPAVDLRDLAAAAWARPREEVELSSVLEQLGTFILADPDILHRLEALIVSNPVLQRSWNQAYRVCCQSAYDSRMSDRLSAEGLVAINNFIEGLERTPVDRRLLVPDGPTRMQVLNAVNTMAGDIAYVVLINLYPLRM